MPLFRCHAQIIHEPARHPLLGRWPKLPETVHDGFRFGRFPRVRQCARKVQLRFGVVGSQRGGAAQHAHGVGRPVEREIGLAQAVEAGGVVGLEGRCRFQIVERGRGLPQLIVEAAARRMSGGEIGLQGQRPIQVYEAFQRIVFAFGEAEFEIAGGVGRMAPDKPLKVGYPLIESASLDGGEAALAASGIVAGLAL